MLGHNSRKQNLPGTSRITLLRADLYCFITRSAWLTDLVYSVNCLTQLNMSKVGQESWRNDKYRRQFEKPLL